MDKRRVGGAGGIRTHEWRFYSSAVELVAYFPGRFRRSDRLSMLFLPHSVSNLSAGFQMQRLRPRAEQSRICRFICQSVTATLACSRSGSPSFDFFWVCVSRASVSWLATSRRLTTRPPDDGKIQLTRYLDTICALSKGSVRPDRYLAVF